MPRFICSTCVAIGLVSIFATVEAAPPTASPAKPALTDKTKTVDTKKATVIRREYGERGTLIVTFEETPHGQNGRDIEYTFKLMPRGGGDAVDFGIDGFFSATPFGSGEADLFLIDAILTSDSTLVQIFGQKWQEGKKEGLYYQAYVRPVDGSVLTWPNGISREVCEAIPPDPRRRPIVTGSLKEGNLVLALEGPKDTLWFAYEFDGKREPGWHLIPAPATKPADPLPAHANPPAKMPPKP
jgi:hypothetical protein